MAVAAWAEAWRRGLAAERALSLRGGASWSVVERDEMRAVEVARPSVRYVERCADGEGGAWRAELRVVLPPPRQAPFWAVPHKAEPVARAFVESFVDVDRLGSVRLARGERLVFRATDGFAVLESFVKLCEALYGRAARGLSARVEDTGGDCPSVEVEAEWRG
jgi:hypothetical protein